MTQAAAGQRQLDVVVVGGCGHVGLPLAIAFADRGLEVGIYDINDDGGEARRERRAARSRSPVRARSSTGRSTPDGSRPAPIPPSSPMPTRSSSWSARRSTSTSTRTRTRSRAPSERRSSSSRDGQLLVLRSTVYPGVTRGVERLFAEHGLAVDVAFCPSASPRARRWRSCSRSRRSSPAAPSEVRDRAAALFRTLTDTIVELDPEEAELAKLFTNTWRYIKFAAANQFYVMANDHGLDFDRIRSALTHDYPRAADMPGAGLRGRPVPAQGHDAAGRVHRQLVRARPRRDARQRGPPALPGHAPGEEVRPGRADGRHPGHGVQGRERRHPLEPVLQAQADPRVPGQRASSAPIPT